MKWRGRRESRNVIDERGHFSHGNWALGKREKVRRAVETINRSATASELGKKSVEGMRKIEAVNRKFSAVSEARYDDKYTQERKRMRQGRAAKTRRIDKWKGDR